MWGVEMLTDLSMADGMNEGLRAYAKERRRRNKLTQEQLAEKIGMSLRAYTDWERGKRSTIKSTLLTKMVEVLEAAPEHIAELLSKPVTPQRARELAHIDKIIHGTDPDELDRIIDEIRARAEKEPALIAVLKVLIGGGHGGDQSH